MGDKHAAGQRAADGNGGDAGFVDPADELFADRLEDDLVAEDHRAVKIAQAGQRENPVFTLVLVVAQVFAEAIENPEQNVPVRIRILFQAMKRLVDQFVVPVDREICDFIRPACHKEGSFFS